jgi:hypothetical protein
MPKKLRPAVDLMAFKCRTLKFNVVQGITTVCCENNTKIINTHCGKNVDIRSLKHVVAYIQLPLSCSG